MTKDTLTFNISPSTFDIEPGRSAEAEIYVRNDSQYVDVYNISVKGRGADWAHVSTPSASIFPGDHVIGKLIVDIPRSYSSESGKYELTVSVNSNRSSHAPRQVSLDINVPEYQEMSAVISESYSAGSGFTGRYIYCLWFICECSEIRHVWWLTNLNF